MPAHKVLLLAIAASALASEEATRTTSNHATHDANTVFTAGDASAPKCFVVDGHTVVHFTSAYHPSFKCTHTNNGAECTCTAQHPTHHYGACMELQHTTGVMYTLSGDCGDSRRSH